MKLPTTASAAILALLALPSSATPEKQQQQRSYPARTIYQFANNATWIENIAVRPNGNLLLTLLDPAAELHEIAFDNNHQARLVHRFDAYQGLTGIAETAPDVFALLAGNYTTNPRSWALWEADFTGATANTTTAAAQINELVSAVPGAAILNGLTTVRQSSTSTSPPSGNDNDAGADAAAVLLMSDSMAGTVQRVELSSPSPRIAVALAADNRTTSPPPDDPTKPTGVNGVRYYHDHRRGADGQQYLYFVNTYRELFCRVRVDPEDGGVVGAVEVLAEGGFRGDDFALRWEEGGVVAYVMDGVDGEVVRVVVGSGEKEVVELREGGEAVVVKSTSAAFGRRVDVDEDVLYVVTRDGKVLAVDLGS